MDTLEQIPQDIKLTRDYNPCAPSVFRWIVIAGYLSIVIAGLFWGLFLVRTHQKDAATQKDEKEIKEIQAKIAALQNQGGQTENLRAKYDNWQSWLSGNYALSKLLGQIYKALPREARLQELIVKQDVNRPRAFVINMKFFAQTTSMTTALESFEEKMSEAGLELQELQQGVDAAGKTELNAMISLPDSYYYLAGSPDKQMAVEDRSEGGIR